MIDYDNIISELGRELGTELTFNDEDMCEMAIGNSFVLSIERRPDAGTLLLTSAVADALPDPVDYALVLDLLEFSLGSAINGMPAIGRDAESGILTFNIRDVFAQGHADAALAASVFHFGQISIPELKEYLRKEKINVRI